MNHLFAFALAAFGAPPEKAVSDPKLTALIRQLGSAEYATREAAFRELASRGGDAAEALAAGAKDADSEVAERCRKLLPPAAAAARAANLARLLKDPAAPAPKALAGLESFLAVTGDTEAGRRLYAEMMGRHYRIIEGLAADPRAASRLAVDAFAAAYDRGNPQRFKGPAGAPAAPADRGDMALFLFVRADARFVDDPAKAPRAAALADGPALRAALAGPKAAPAVQKLFLHWLREERQGVVRAQGFKTAGQVRMKAALPAALRAMADEAQSADCRAHALLAAAKVGGKDGLKDVAALLGDRADLGTVTFGGGPSMAIQLRDVALGVSVQLTGRRAADYGFAGDPGAGGIPDEFAYFAFPDDAAREKAHAKWAAWVKSQAAPAKK